MALFFTKFFRRNSDQLDDLWQRAVHIEDKLNCLLKNISHHPMRRIAFLHVPKCAGTSLTESLIKSINPACPIGGADRTMYGTFDDFKNMPWEDQQYIYRSGREISPLSDFLSGHFALSNIIQWDKDASILLIAREPRSRILSLWTFWRESAEINADIPESLHCQVLSAHGTFYEFLNNKNICHQVDNIITRMLLYPDILIPENDFIDPKYDSIIMEKVIEKLECFSHINVIENKHLYRDLEQWLKLPLEKELLKITNATHKHLSADLYQELTDDCIESLKNRTRLDRRIWEIIVEQRVQCSDITTWENEIFEENKKRYAQLLSEGGES